MNKVELSGMIISFEQKEINLKFGGKMFVGTILLQIANTRDDREIFVNLKTKSRKLYTLAANFVDTVVRIKGYIDSYSYNGKCYDSVVFEEIAEHELVKSSHPDPDDINIKDYK